jgi:hypothetical protein
MLPFERVFLKTEAYAGHVFAKDANLYACA